MLVMKTFILFSTRPLVLVLIATSVMLFSGGTARADQAVLYVAPTGGGGGSCGAPDYNTIQAAVDAAIPGDRLIVCQGQYNESVVLREKHGILIQADRDAVVIVTPRGLGGKAQRDAFILSRSREVTIEGLRVTGASRSGFLLMGGNDFNRDITLAGNEIYDNGFQCRKADCGGIVIGDENARTWVVNNLVRNNQPAGMEIGGSNIFSDAPIYAVNNTIVENGGNGLSVAPQRSVYSVNNLILDNGKDAGRNGGRWGIDHEVGKKPGNANNRHGVSFPERMLLKSNLMYQNGAGKKAGDGGDIGGQTRDTLDATDTVNYTTRGNEGPDGIGGCVFADCGAGHGLDEIVKDPTGRDYHLAAGSPASSKAAASFIHGGREWVPGVDFEGERRPRGASDIGYDQGPPAVAPEGNLISGILNWPQTMFFKFTMRTGPRGSAYHRFTDGPGTGGPTRSNPSGIAAPLEPLAAAAGRPQESLAAQVAGAQRVGIVYSESTASNYFSDIVYSQMFMAMQNQVMMAGIPFDLLTENDLADVSQISSYDALVFPYFANCCVDDQGNSMNPDTIAANIVQSGAGIITFGDFMTNDPQGAAFCTPPYCNPYQHMIDVLGLSIIGAAGPVDVDVRAKANTHAVMKNYGANEIILGRSQPSHPQTPTTPPVPYSDYFTNLYAGVGAAAEVLVELDLDNGIAPQTRDGVMAVAKNGGRHVHFANDWLMGNSNLVWEALQWSVYGDEDTSVGLKIGRQKSIFIARDDADSTKYPDEAARVLPGLKVLYEQWKNDYNFVGTDYINIGNDSPDETTDWNFSGPYYQDYIGLGHEIGTHSYTHPDIIDNLTESELQFEFCQSRTEIENQLGITVSGAAVPGNPEMLATDSILDQQGCLSYLSGRYANVGIGYPGAIGYLNANPTDDMVYFNLNMWPDFTAIQWYGWTAAQTEQEWGRQMDLLGKHASQPILHPLWHDYGPTIAGGDGYTPEMYAYMFAKAYNEDTEFANLVDIQQRFKTFQGASLEVTHAAAAPGEETITAAVTGSGVGKFSLEVNSRDSENKLIKSVDD
jgi:hypothetical protein